MIGCPAQAYRGEGVDSLLKLTRVHLMINLLADLLEHGCVNE
jgi:hypothetical protein